ncbi:MAG: xylan 1,4-beta-xylosidase [Oscillospiraceae bacterium]|nr:xylan 1,4-beta-xylosidase [Oscillospiraceae bacterium]
MGNGIGFSGLSSVERIIVDTKTGVNYALTPGGQAMCVLVDRDGKPIVTPVE